MSDIDDEAGILPAIIRKKRIFLTGHINSYISIAGRGGSGRRGVVPD